jgi:hypothetical protein
MAVSVCLAIPIYRLPLRLSEAISLKRCVDVLGHFPIAVFVPQGLDVTELLTRWPNLTVEVFDRDFFNDVNSYNRLMLSDSFYKRFESFSYLLVHQLDAFVFGDELASWCDRGFDYIGSPWLYRRMPWTSVGYGIMALRRRIYQYFDFTEPPNGGIHRAQYMGSAGNGGFSLRRVERMREVLRLFDVQAERYRIRRHFSHSEDIFFCVEANRFRNEVRIPNFHEAMKFGWEAFPKFSMRLNRRVLPFGCHAWDREEFRKEWQPIFNQFGYTLDSRLSSPVDLKHF